MHDITVFRQAGICALGEGEKVEEDKGYVGKGLHINKLNAFGLKDEERMKALARSCHETINGCNKMFGVLAQNF